MEKQHKKPLKEKICRAMYRIKLKLLSFIKTPTIKSRYGILLATNFYDVTFGFYVRGAYGSYYWDRLSTIDSDFIFIDIGANQGLYAICAAKNRHNIASYAFEPVEKTFRLLEKNVALNKVSEKCHLIQKAISNEASITQIGVKEGHSGGASMALGSFIKSEYSIEEIECIDGAGLDSIVNAIPDIPIVVKIDVEGFEKNVIEGLQQSALINNITEIFYEVNLDWVEAKEIELMLVKLGFSGFEKNGNNRLVERKLFP